MESARTKQRSPNYPSTDLGAAIENARKLWNVAGRRRLSQEDAVRAWGYGSLSGASRSRMAALRQYGLIEIDKEGDVALTRRGQVLALGADPSSSDYDMALKEAALTPEIFRELYDTRRLASDEAIRRHLVLDRKFSEDGARKLVESFRMSLALAKLDGESYEGEDAGTGESGDGRQSGEYRRTDNSAESKDKGREQHALDTPAAISEQYSWPIPPDMTVEIKFQGAKVTGAHIEMLKGYLTFYQKRLEELERAEMLELGVLRSEMDPPSSTGELDQDEIEADHE